jgi:hypothetical protein
VSAKLNAIGSVRTTLHPASVITTAGTVLGTPLVGNVAAKYLAAQAVFTYGSAGTSVNVYIQTSLDGGATWLDIMNFSFTTATSIKVSAVTTGVALAPATSPGDGTLTANTILNGLIGDRVRAKIVSVGTYATSTTIRVELVTKG